LSSGDPSDWLVLAMRGNMQLSVSGDRPAQVRSGLWASQFHKVLRSLGELSVWPDGVTGMQVDAGTPSPTVDVDHLTEAFHQHVFISRTAFSACCQLDQQFPLFGRNQQKSVAVCVALLDRSS